MWSWDSVEITFDQTCWTFDGYDGCDSETIAFGLQVTRAHELELDVTTTLSNALNVTITLIKSLSVKINKTISLLITILKGF